MNIFTSAQAFQQTRHARRLYVGGIPPNYTDEEELKSFLNAVIAKGLNDENDGSFVLSIYINQKKCFAFIELCSIELATACLSLDGLIFKKVVLKVLRANEYKPELIPPSLVGKPINLDLSSFQFGNSGHVSVSSKSADPKITDKIDSIIKFVPLHAIELGAVTVVGYPFDGVNQRDSLPKVASTATSTAILASKGCASAPRSLRNQLRKYKFGSLDNPEFGINMSSLKILDLGDVVGGKSVEETSLYLASAVQEIVQLGGLPFIIGGSQDIFQATAMGVSKAIAGHTQGLGLVTISAHLRDLQVSESSPRSPLLEDPSLTHVRFAVQGSHCMQSTANQVLQSGGKIVWLSRDLRGSRVRATSHHFRDALEYAKRDGNPVVVALDMSAAAGAVGGASLNSCGPQGLTTDEILDLAMIAGADPNVICFELADFCPEPDDSRDNLMLSEIFYRFNLGVASRSGNTIPPSWTTGVSLSMEEALSYAVYAPSSSASSPLPMSPHTSVNLSQQLQAHPLGSSGLESNRSSANISQGSLSLSGTPASGDRSVVRSFVSAPPGPPSTSFSTRPPSFHVNMTSNSNGLDYFTGTTTGESSARTSVRLSVGSLTMSDADGSRPNSLNAFKYPESMVSLPFDDLSMEDVASKHYGRKMDPVRADGLLEAVSSPFGQFPDHAHPGEAFEGILSSTKDRSGSNSIYNFNVDQARRSGFRLSSSPFPQGIHPGGQRSMPRTYSNTSAGDALDLDGAYYPTSSGHYHLSSSNAMVGFAINPEAPPPNGAEMDILTGLRYTPDPSPAHSIWRR